MKKLAINGGEKIRTKLFPRYNTINDAEKKAVADVLDKGILSQYLASWHTDFYGGQQVQLLEKKWAEYFNVKYAIAVNSATSGLYCAMGATGIEPGDEVIVSPYTMSASAVAPLVYNGIPIFADIEEDYFCLDPDDVEKKITKKTKAIIVVDIFGQPYNADKINAIAKKHNLFVIEDAAQAPGAKYKGKYAGTLGDIGVFSLNYHKHIHCGEGGIIVTDNKQLAEKMQLIRNHAEAVVEAKGEKNLVNMIGFNYRMTEMEAAVAQVQLMRLDKLLSQRRENRQYITNGIKNLTGIEPVKIRDDCEHSFYVDVFKVKEKLTGIDRDTFINAVKAELAPTETRENHGVLMGCGYVKPLYLQPIFLEKTAYGSSGYPFNLYKGDLCYKKGLCPTVEKMHYKELVTHELMNPPATTNDLDDVINAIKKVYTYRQELTKKVN